MTETAELVEGLMPPVVRLLAVTVWLPLELNVTLKVWLPATSGAFAGSVARLSLELKPTVSVTLVRRFQQASTALTETVKALATVCTDGVPVLPLPDPGDAVSPGTSNCNLV